VPRLSLNIHTALLISLAAAIGIEPMNKGFAVLPNLFARKIALVCACAFSSSFSPF